MKTKTSYLKKHKADRRSGTHQQAAHIKRPHVDRLIAIADFLMDDACEQIGFDETIDKEALACAQESLEVAEFLYRAAEKELAHHVRRWRLKECLRCMKKPTKKRIGFP